MSLNNQYTNQLIKESSVYLLQHAHNPVNWYAWGEEALNKAKEEGKPILLSIGYAACHWCHVMERESFEDEATAAIMNAHFINIKVDREERPDIDHIYMDAVQAMTGSGGWPLNVFLTPELKPFYGGTYFPPVDAHNRLSWKEVLRRVHYTYAEKKADIYAQADRLTDHLNSANLFGIDKQLNEAENPFTAATLQTIADNIINNSDKEWGGFGKAPKFPQTFSIQFLLRHYHYTKDEASLAQATLSLDKMIYGGIYDQVGGGFSRYSTDTKWQIPHFEKMLYDNALLLGVLSEAYQITKNELYANTIRQTIAYLQREMLHESGGFYSALDADSEGVEGKFYTWTKKEVEELLGADAELFCAFFQVTEEGNWEEVNILWTLQSTKEFAELHSIKEAHLISIINAGLEKLLIERTKRIRPQLDDKILLNWNALMITGLCKAYEALLDENYKNLAINCMAFIENTLTKVDNTLLHTYKNGVAKIDAFLDDYAYTIQAYISLNNITGDNSYIAKAIGLVNTVDAKFKDSVTGLYYYTAENQADIIVRKKELYDGATPSANAIMMYNLLFLTSGMIDNSNLKDLVINNVAALMKGITNYPTSFGVWAIVVQLIVTDVKEINIYGTITQKETNAIANWYFPEKIILTKSIDNLAKITNVILPNSLEIQGESAVFSVCTKYTCSTLFVNLTDFYNYLTKA